MINLRKELHAYLKTRHSNVFFQEAPTDAPFPYITYDFRLVDDSENTQLVSLEIDGWDKSIDTTRLEEMMINIDLDKEILTSNSLAIVFFRQSITPLNDPEPKINRRKYAYLAYLHERS